MAKHRIQAQKLLLLAHLVMYHPSDEDKTIVCVDATGWHDAMRSKQKSRGMQAWDNMDEDTRSGVCACSMQSMVGTSLELARVLERLDPP